MRHLGKLEAVLHRLDDRGQVRPRVEQPDLRLHRVGVRALLHDRGAFAIVLADDDQRPAGDAAGGEIGDRVGSDVDPDRGFEGDRAADRIVHRGGEHGRGRGLRRRVLEVHAEVVEHVLGVGQHVHQVGDRRSLVAADIGDAGLQQRLGDRENSLAAEFLAFAQLEVLNLAGKRPLRHKKPSASTASIEKSGRPPVTYETFPGILQRLQGRPAEPRSRNRGAAPRLS